MKELLEYPRALMIRDALNHLGGGDRIHRSLEEAERQADVSCCVSVIAISQSCRARSGELSNRDATMHCNNVLQQCSCFSSTSTISQSCPESFGNLSHRDAKMHCNNSAAFLTSQYRKILKEKCCAQCN